MLHLLCHQGPLGTVCLQQDSDHACFWPGYHLHNDTAKHGYSGVEKEKTGEWNGALLSSVMRVDSVCMRVMDEQMYGAYLMGVIFRSAFVHDIHAPPLASWCGRPSVTTLGRIWYFCRVKPTVPAIFHRLLTPCYCHFFDRKVRCFSAVRCSS